MAMIPVFDKSRKGLLAFRGIFPAMALAAFLSPVFFPGGGAFAMGAKGYVGSEKCKDCHEGIYAQWKLTPHARMLRNAYRDPKAVEATDFNPKIPFRKNDIYFTIGSHWLQKYLTLMGGQFYVLPKYWNIAEAKWEPYTIFNWQEETYPLYCNGCHVAGFDPKTRSYTEESITCESCHGPGGKHVDSEGDIKFIVNPARLGTERRDMICEACHTDGKDKATETFPFPAGYKAGDDLGEYYSDFFLPKPKSKEWYWGDVSYYERHRMFMFFQTKFYSTDRACDVCGFDRGITAKEVRKMSRSEYCGTCHREVIKKYVDHAFHTTTQATCDDCHVPTVTRNGSRYSIHDHKFDFSRPKPPCAECHGPELVDKKGKSILKEAGVFKDEPVSHTHFNINPVKITQNLKPAEACLRCHKEKDEKWARDGIANIRSRGFLTKSE